MHTDARVVVVLNLEPQAGETHGYGPEDHLAALFEHAPDLKIHTVLADRASVGRDAGRAASTRWRRPAPAASSPTWPATTAPPRHDPAKLAAAYAADHRRG